MITHYKSDVLDLTIRELEICLQCDKESYLSDSYYYFDIEGEKRFLCIDCFNSISSIKQMDEWLAINVLKLKKKQKYYFYKDKRLVTVNKWQPTKDLNQCFIMEREIGVSSVELFDEYFKLLSTITYETNSLGRKRRLFALTNASSKQKSLAFYLLFKEKIKKPVKKKVSTSNRPLNKSILDTPIYLYDILGSNKKGLNAF